jgi:hypothetical protein
MFWFLDTHVAAKCWSQQWLAAIAVYCFQFLLYVQNTSINTWLSIFNSMRVAQLIYKLTSLELHYKIMPVGCLHRRAWRDRRCTDDIGWDEGNETLHWAPLEPSRHSLNWGLQPRNPSRRVAVRIIGDRSCSSQHLSFTNQRGSYQELILVRIFPRPVAFMFIHQTTYPLALCQLETLQ